MPTVHILKSNILALDVDAVANPANTSLRAGNGLCGLIHKSAGKEFEEECKLIGGCPTGQAVITGGYNLKAAHVIYGVGPHYYRDRENDSILLESCYLIIYNVHLLIINRTLYV